MTVRMLRPLAAVGVLALGGCASVVGGSTQTIAVQASAPAGPLAGALCRLGNDKGSWDVVTPGTVDVARSFAALAVRCEREGFEPAVTSVASSTQAVAFGNIVIGGMIGAAVDVSTGAAYSYPDIVTVGLTPLAGAAAPAPGVAQSLALVPLAVGDLFEYEVEDRFTGQKRRVARRVAEVDADRVVYGPRERVETGAGRVLELAAPLLGDLDQFEPPRGWLPERPLAGMVERQSYRARDAAPGSRVDLRLRVLAPMLLRTPAGEFRAWPVEAEGYAARPVPLMADAQHTIRLKVWVDAATRRPLRFESELVSIGPQATGRPSRERVELVGLQRAGGLAFPPPAMPPAVEAPTAAVVVTPIPLALGDLFEFDLEDRFTGQKRRVQRRVDAMAGGQVSWNQGERVESADGRVLELRAPTLGDAEAFEPPRGWLPASPAAGLQEELSYTARDGSPGSRVRITLRTLAPMPVQTPVGPVPVWPLVAEGFAMRRADAVEVQHRVVLRIWVDARTRRVVRFESEIAPQGAGSQAGRPSRERLELQRLQRGAG